MEDSTRILYLRFKPKEHRHLLPMLIECYRDVFADTPWNEWKKCSVCNKQWGVTEREDLALLGFQHCGQLVEDFWPHKVVEEEILHQVNDKASCWIAMTKQRVIGFTWGYPMTPEALARKLERPEMVANLKKQFGDPIEVAYQAELGVLTEFRGKKVARELVAKRLEDFQSQGLKVGVVRTKRNPPSVTYLWFIRDGYQPVAEYHDEGERVILARSYTGYRVSA